MHEIPLVGCMTTPLLGYLSGLGVFRLVAEQADHDVRACWQDGHLVLETSLDPGDLVNFLLYAYRPTPFVSPWNGSSGFDPKTAPDSTDILADTTEDRFAGYREAISVGRRLVAEHGDEIKSDKDSFLRRCRARLPDSTLEWLDVGVVLRDAGTSFMPLMGTGNNDGRLEFSRNHMQRLAVVFGLSGAKRSHKDVEDGRRNARGWLEAVLFALDGPDRRKGDTPGQFDPAGSVDVNVSSEGSAESYSNPWSFILGLEGAVVFGAALSRRAGSEGGGTAAFPFTVRAGVGGQASAGSVSEARDGSRDELWLPVWEQPASYRTIRHVFAEGRAQVSHRRGQAREAIDFLRATASLGTDRGIE